MTASTYSDELKNDVREHWNAHPCGTRDLPETDRRAFFDQLERERYEAEPYIREFADFESGRDKRVLEIGIGAGTDFVNWARHGADLVGVDLTESGVHLARERLQLEDLSAGILIGDAERLPFPSNSFDIVYSYGVIHHTPDSNRAIADAYRVLRPAGALKLMLYHYPSWTAIMVWAYNCLLRGHPFTSARRAVYDYLESPGTKCYTKTELCSKFSHLDNLRIQIELTAGDLLKNRPSEAYQGSLAKLIWQSYPRRFVRQFGRGLGLAALVQGRKRQH